MCDYQNGFKLCTCNDLDISQADWILRRRNKDGGYKGFIIGESDAKMILGDSDKEIQECILEKLNNEDGFDFEYLPNQGDLIQFKMEGGYIYFEFKDERWASTTKDNLTIGYKNILSGKIDEDLNESLEYKPVKKLPVKSNFSQRMQIGKGTKVIKKGNGKPHNIKL